MPLQPNSNSKKLELSVVLPVHNENPHIESVLLSWLEELRYEQISFEMIIVNDGSLDGTGRILDRLRKENPEIRLVHQLNLGQDRAFRRGYEIARGQYVLSITGNGRVEPSDFVLMWKNRAQGYLILARRSHRLDSYLSRKLSSFLSVLMKVFFKTELEEPNTTLRLSLKEISEPLLKMIPLQSNCFQWCFTALTETVFPGKVVEVTVPYRHRIERQSPFRRKSLLGTAWSHVLVAIRLKWRLRQNSKLDRLSQSDEMFLT